MGPASREGSGSFWGSHVLLKNRFFREATEAPVPLDLGALSRTRRSSQGLLAPPVASRPGFGEQQPRLLPRNRKAQRPHTLDLEHKVVGWCRRPGGERASADTAQQPGELLACSRSHLVFLRAEVRRRKGSSAYDFDWRWLADGYWARGKVSAF